MDKKYSTGTKGRLEKHADLCKEIIRRRCDDFHLAEEYIESIDPDRENKVWQKYQSPEDCLPALELWLDGGIPAEIAPAVSPLPIVPGVQPASKLAAPPAKAPVVITGDAVMEALERTQTWLQQDGVRKEFSLLDQAEAIEKALQQFQQEILHGN